MRSTSTTNKGIAKPLSFRGAVGQPLILGPLYWLQILALIVLLSGVLVSSLLTSTLGRPVSTSSLMMVNSERLPLSLIVCSFLITVYST